MGLYNKNGELNGKTIIFYNNYTDDIIVSVTPNNTPIDISNFIQEKILSNNSSLSMGSVSFIFCDSNEYMHFLNSDYDLNAKLIVKNGKLDLEIREMDLIKNENIIYGKQKYKRDYTVEQIQSMYTDDYINFNLKNLLLSGNVEYEFIPIKDLNVRNDVAQVSWRDCQDDPFLAEYTEDKINLGLDIVENGTYWPFITSMQDDGNLYVYEGNHRIISLKLCAFNGYIDENFKVFCIKAPYDWKEFKTARLYEETLTPFDIHFVLENRYGSELIVNDFIYEKVCEDIINKGGKLVSDYTGEITVYKNIDILFGASVYPLYLRDLIFEYTDVIKPSSIINNEEEFDGWWNDVLTHSQS